LCAFGFFAVFFLTGGGEEHQNCKKNTNVTECHIRCWF
jgi:hypothetical protein